MNLSQYTINNLYSDLKDDCYSKSDYPISFLRATHRLSDPWILEKLLYPQKILEIGCGVGILANTLAKAGHQVTGVDLSKESLEIAHDHDETHSVSYFNANAYSLPFPDDEFDAVCVMDVLEHVEEPYLLIGEAARVLKKTGTLFFYTFNRTPLSYFWMIKGIKPCFAHPYHHMHDYPMLVRPEEIEDMLVIHKLRIKQLIGIRPCLYKSIWKMFVMHQVPQDFSFCFCKNLSVGYCGYACKGCHSGYSLATVS